MKNLINGKANAATTLAGYGITDGMTATEIASAISTAIAGTDHLSRVMVDSTADIDVAADGAEKKIYMVKNTDGEAGNLYSEYMVIDGKLEKVGDWKVDLSSYAKTAEVTAAIANALKAYAKTADVTKAINAAVAGLIQLDDLSVAPTGAGNVVTGLAYDNKTGKFTVNLFKDTRWLLTLLINEALLAEDENAQLLEEKRVGRLIHAGNLQEVQNAIFKSFYRGTAGDNSDTENENDGEETTEEGNRAAVQEN